MTRPGLVVLGGPNSGKTHYGGQIYGRLRRAPGRLKLRDDEGTPADLEPFEEVLRALEEGRAAGHTPLATSHAVMLPIEAVDGRAFDLRWPDYGGEQISAIEAGRAVSEDWQSRLAAAHGWVILIRLTGQTTYPDALEELTRRASVVTAKDGMTPRARRWDANARWVELLQILLHVAGHGTACRRHRPPLAVLLSCYDELGVEAQRPSAVLAERLPMVASFVEATWAPDSVSIWGLSALGRLLEQDSADEGFIDEGPETQGWVVPPEGGCGDPDLTRPIAWLLERL